MVVMSVRVKVHRNNKTLLRSLIQGHKFCPSDSIQAGNKYLCKGFFNLGIFDIMGQIILCCKDLAILYIIGCLEVSLASTH